MERGKENGPMKGGLTIDQIRQGAGKRATLTGGWVLEGKVHVRCGEDARVPCCRAVPSRIW